MSIVAKRLEPGCINMPLGTELGLSLNGTVLHGDPAPSEKGTTPNFWPMTIVAKRLYASVCHLVRR